MAIVPLSAVVAQLMSFSTVAARQVPGSWPEALWLTYVGGAVGIRLSIGRAADRIRPGRLVFPVFLALIFATISAALADTTRGFMLSGLFGGLGHGLGFPVLTSQLMARTPVRQRGAAMAILTGFWEVAALLFMPLFGAIGDAWGTQTMFGASTLLSVACLFAWGALEMNNQPALRDGNAEYLPSRPADRR